MFPSFRRLVGLHPRKSCFPGNSAVAVSYHEIEAGKVRPVGQRSEPYEYGDLRRQVDFTGGVYFGASLIILKCSEN